MATPAASSRAGGRPVLLTVSGRIASDLAASVATGTRPRADYAEMASACNADLVDQGDAAAAAGPLARVLARLGGQDALLAAHCFRRRTRYRVVLTDGEGVGLLFAAFCRLAPRRVRHVMIGHRLSPAKKVWLHRLLRLRRRIDHVVVYSSPQRDVAVDRLGYEPDQVTVMPFMVDTHFWSPQGLATRDRDRPMICSAGRELRDYRTLIEAVRDLDVDVILAAASPWSRREDSAAGLDLPSHVTVTSLGQFELRQLYADATLVVVPIEETDFQAGITTILEAMSMARAVVCTRTTGQHDTILDGVSGLYVPPGDAVALRSAIVRLLGDPELTARLGGAGQGWVREHADIAVYSRRFAELTQTAAPS